MFLGCVCHRRVGCARAVDSDHSSFCRFQKNRSDGEAEGDETQGEIPPVGNFRVNRHEAGMYISLITNTATELADDVMTIPDYEGNQETR